MVGAEGDGLARLLEWWDFGLDQRLKVRQRLVGFSKARGSSRASTKGRNPGDTAGAPLIGARERRRAFLRQWQWFSPQVLGKGWRRPCAGGGGGLSSLVRCHGSVRGHRSSWPPQILLSHLRALLFLHPYRLALQARNLAVAVRLELWSSC